MLRIDQCQLDQGPSTQVASGSVAFLSLDEGSPQRILAGTGRKDLLMLSALAAWGVIGVVLAGVSHI